MNSKIILVCGFADHTIQEYFKDADIVLFNSILDLKEHLVHTPERAARLVFTSDVTDSNAAVAMNMLVEILNNNFFKVGEVTFVAEEGSPTLPLIEFLQQNKDIHIDEIAVGKLSKEFLSASIKGTHVGAKQSTRIAVSRLRRDDYIKEEMDKKRREGDPSYKAFETHRAAIEEDRLPEAGPVEFSEFSPTITSRQAKLLQVVGGEGRGKTTFSIILAQTIAKSQRVLLIESDFQYFSLSYYLKQAGIDCEYIYIEDLYTDPMEVQEQVLNSDARLFAVVGDSSLRGSNFSPSFITRLCVSLFRTQVNYIVLEAPVSNMLTSTKTIFVLNNELIPILRDLQEVPLQIDNFDFVALSTSPIMEHQIVDSQELTLMVEEILNITLREQIPIYKLESFKIGEMIYDLRRYT